LIAKTHQERARVRLADIVAAFALVALNKDNLAERVWKRFWEKERTGTA